MTTDELIELKREAKKHAKLLEDAGLHRSRIYTLIHSDLPIVIDQLIRANTELEASGDQKKSNIELALALQKTDMFPTDWILERVV